MQWPRVTDKTPSQPPSHVAVGYTALTKRRAGKNTVYTVFQTKNSAIADKPRDAFRSVKVTKRFDMLAYGFLLVCYSNFVIRRTVLEIFNV